MSDTPETLCPHPDDPLMAGAWLSALRVALETPMIVSAYEQDTGNHFMPPCNRIDRMIDEATGYGEQYVHDFIVWFNENVWGET